MKICILSYRFFTGGFTGSLLPLLKHLNARGIEVDLMLFEKGDEDKMDTSFVNIVYNGTPRRSMSKIEKAIRLFFTPHFVEQRKYRKKHESNAKKRHYPSGDTASAAGTVHGWAQNDRNYVGEEKGQKGCKQIPNKYERNCRRCQGDGAENQKFQILVTKLIHYYTSTQSYKGIIRPF